MAKPHDFMLTRRPPTFSTVPPGFLEFLPGTQEFPFGGVRYDRILTSDEIETYELWPVNPNHPLNLRKEFEAFHQDFQTRFIDAGETWRIGGEVLVTPSTVPGMSWQMTFFDKGTPTAHLDFDDFTDLSRKVWGIERTIRNRVKDPQASVEVPDNVEDLDSDRVPGLGP
jgi:hypothetical protein